MKNGNQIKIILIALLIAYLIWNNKILTTTALQSGFNPECDTCSTYVSCDCSQQQPKHCQKTVLGKKFCNPLVNDCFTYCHTFHCGAAMKTILDGALLAGSCTAAAAALTSALIPEGVIFPEIIPVEGAMVFAFNQTCQYYVAQTGGWQNVLDHSGDIADTICAAGGFNS